MLDYIGHVQIAGVPHRGEPDCGELAYKDVLLALDAAGYDGYGPLRQQRKVLGKGVVKNDSKNKSKYVTRSFEK